MRGLPHVKGMQDNLLPSLRISVGRGIKGGEPDQKNDGEEIVGAARVAQLGEARRDKTTRDKMVNK